MAKNDGKQETTPDFLNTPGTWNFSDLVGAMGEEGFSSIETVVLGSKEDGKIPVYLGVLLERGSDIVRDDEESNGKPQPTYVFNPITRRGVVTNITHVVPATYMIHGACERILKLANERGQIAVCGFIYTGQTNTRGKKRVNKYQIFERYFPKETGVKFSTTKLIAAPDARVALPASE